MKLTPKGKELILRGIKDRYHWVEPLAEKLTPEERAKVNEALIIMTEAARQMEAASVQHMI